jgi:hypothetical protein
MSYGSGNYLGIVVKLAGAGAFMNEASMTRAGGATPYFMQGPGRKQLPKNGTTEIFGWSRVQHFALQENKSHISQGNPGGW